jgi:VanZ family protein
MITGTQSSPPSRLRRLWSSVGVVLIALVLFLSLRPEPVEEHPVGLDKFEHALAYGVLMFWFAHLVPARAGRVRLAIALAGMGVAIECLPGLSGYRHFSAFDMAANGLGVLLGWLAAPPRVPHVLDRFEARAARAGR